MPPMERQKIGGAGIHAEQRLAKRLQGRLMPGSGSSSGRGGGKGDMNLDRKVKFKLEAKSTVNDSFSIKLSWLQKIVGEAFHSGRTPALSIQFVTGDGNARVAGSWVAIPEELFNEVFGDG